MRAFVHAMRDAESDQALTPLLIGDPRTHSVDAIKSLFEDGFAHVDVAEYDLCLDGTPDQVRAVLLGFYNLHRLSPEGNIAVQERLDTQMAQSALPDGTVPLSLPMRRILAIRT